MTIWIHAFVLEVASYVTYVWVAFVPVYLIACKLLGRRILSPIGIVGSVILAALLMPFALSLVVQAVAPLPGSPAHHSSGVSVFLLFVAAGCCGVGILVGRRVDVIQSLDTTRPMPQATRSATILRTSPTIKSSVGKGMIWGATAGMVVFVLLAIDPRSQHLPNMLTFVFCEIAGILVGAAALRK